MQSVYTVPVMRLPSFFIKMQFILLPVLASAFPGKAEETDAEPSRYGVTCFSVNFLREQPDFPRELGNQLLMGTPVEITGREGYWMQVVSPDPYKAWCVEMGIAEMTGEELQDYIAAPKYIVTAEYSHVFSSPSERSERISDLVMGDLLRIVFPKNGPRQGRHAGSGGISCRGFFKVLMPSGVEGYVRKKDMEEFGKWAAGMKATGENIIKTARLFLGTPYLWGGTSIKGVDCSGLSRMVWFMNGVLLPRNASQQAKTGTCIPYPGQGNDSVDRETMLEFCSSLIPGDLIFFGSGKNVSHVGIYIGKGHFIHASQYVRTSSLIPGDEDYYELSWKLLHACRIIGQEDRGSGVESMLGSPAYFPQK